MDKQEGEQKNISIYWWNMGNKTLDFKGTIKDYLIKKDIKVTRITNKYDKDIKGYRFRIPLGSCSATLDIFDQNYIRCVNEAIKIFHSLLGDKTLYHSPYRTYKINWR